MYDFKYDYFFILERIYRSYVEYGLNKGDREGRWGMVCKKYECLNYSSRDEV